VHQIAQRHLQKTEIVSLFIDPVTFLPQVVRLTVAVTGVCYETDSKSVTGIDGFITVEQCFPFPPNP
jgi:hypothetical protein